MEVRNSSSYYKVELLPHDPQWIALYQSEASKLTAIFGDELVAIDHIGSTSVPTIKAKPIIDILIQVRTETLDNQIITQLDMAGYTERNFNDGKARRTFNKDHNGLRLFNVHVVRQGDAFGQRMHRFSELLREDEGLAKQYEALKIETASIHKDSDSYYKAKSFFIQNLMHE